MPDVRAAPVPGCARIDASGAASIQLERPRAHERPSAMDDASGDPDGPGGADPIRPEDLLLEEMQRDLLARLPVYSSIAADAYAGALCVYYGMCYTDRSSHLAYAVRDVVDHLARSKQTESEKRMPMSKDARKSLLKMAFDPITKSAYGHKAHYETLVDEYSRLSEVAHGRNPAMRRVPFDSLPRIEHALHDLSFPQTTTNKIVDKIISEGPSDSGAKSLIKMIQTGATQYRIIDTLPPGWLDCMDKADFFKDPKGHWAAHRYLYRCADRHPGRVAEIITRYDHGVIRSNPSMYGDFLDCALRIQKGHAAKISRFLIKDGLHDLFVHYPDKYLKVAAMLCLDGERGLAMDMARAALTIKNVNHNYPGSDWLDVPIREFADATMRVDPLPLFGILADLLEDLIKEETSDGILLDIVSSMSSKRPTIEESDQNIHDFESSLVVHLRNCLVIMGKADPARLHGAMEIMEKKGLLIYRRLEMFAYDAFPDMFKKEMEAYAARYLDHFYTYHEHYVMLKNHYCSMSDSAKSKVSYAIARPTASNAAEDGSVQSDDKAAYYEFRQLRCLECIKDCLDSEQSATYQRLVKKHGELSHPGYRSFRGYGRIEPERGAGPLEGKDTGQVIDIVRQHRPDGGLFPDMTMHGFSYLASMSPEEFSRRAMDLAGADLDAQERFFRSMGSALKDGKSIDWDSTIRLMQHVSKTLAKNKSRSIEETALAACSMLEDAFQHAPPDAEFRDGLRSVILDFVKLANSKSDDYLDTFEAAINSDDGTIDAINTSINNLGGRSFLVMMMYALWCYDNTGKAELVSEVRNVLDEYLEGTHTISRDAVLGAYLPSLHFFDKKRTLDMAKKIRTSVSSKIAFWDGFVRWNYLDRGVFTSFQDIYREFLTGSMSKILKIRETFKSTFSHSLSAYLYGYDDSENTFEGFLKSIEKNPSEDLIDHCVFQVGVVVRGIRDSTNFDTDRLARIWRNSAFADRDLTSWFVGSKAGRDVSIKLYAEHISKYPGTPPMQYHLLDELKSYADDFPEEVAASLCRLAENNHNSHQAKSIEEVTDILEKHRNQVGDKLDKIAELAALNRY